MYLSIIFTLYKANQKNRVNYLLIFWEKDKTCCVNQHLSAILLHISEPFPAVDMVDMALNSYLQLEVYQVKMLIKPSHANQSVSKWNPSKEETYQAGNPQNNIMRSATRIQSPFKETCQTLTNLPTDGFPSVVILECATDRPFSQIHWSWTHKITYKAQNHVSKKCFISCFITCPSSIIP